MLEKIFEVDVKVWWSKMTQSMHQNSGYNRVY